MPLKGLDIAVALHLATRGAGSWTYADLGDELCASPSTVNQAVHRLLPTGLLVLRPGQGKPEVGRAALLEFLQHGVRFAFHGSPGRPVRGVPTGHSASPLSERISGAGEPHVWAHPKGEVRGLSFPPLYPGVAEAARRSRRLHEVLALCDAVRGGRVRERRLALELLGSRIQGVPGAEG